MLINKRSGTWTLGELYLCDREKKSSDNLSFSDWISLSQPIGGGDGVYSDFFFGLVKNPPSFLTDENKDTISQIIMHNYKTMTLPRSFENLDGILKYQNILGILYPLEGFKTSIAFCVKQNEYKWQKLYVTLGLTYDPITNYDRTETTTVTREGEETNTLTKTGTEKDEKNGNHNYSKDGTETNSRSGSDDISYTGGSSSTPSGTTVQTHRNSAFNEPGELTTETEDTTSYNGMTTVEQYRDRKDITTYDTKNILSYENRKDSETYSDATVHSFSDRTDTNSGTTNETETTESRIKGNIGVTTSQQMIESEREVALFNWASVVADDIVSYICKPEYFNPLEYYRCKEMGGNYEY